jgi:hypothetical protein
MVAGRAQVEYQIRRRGQEREWRRRDRRATLLARLDFLAEMSEQRLRLDQVEAFRLCWNP